MPSTHLNTYISSRWNEVCKRTTVRNINRDNGYRESMATTTQRSLRNDSRQRQRQGHKSRIWLVEWGIIALHVRHAFWCNFLTKFAKRWREIFIFEVLTTTLARNSESFIPCLYRKTILVKQAKLHFGLFCTTWPTWNNRRTLNLTESSILIGSFRLNSCRTLLDSLKALRPKPEATLFVSLLWFPGNLGRLRLSFK